jgi:hypothetical protein
LFSNEIALAAGANAIDGVHKQTGYFSNILQNTLAFSAIDEGARVFGDTGIRALFDDANELGEAVAPGDASSTLKDAGEAIAKVFVQYARQLAIGKVEQSDALEALEGVLALSSDKAQNQNGLSL